MNKKVAVYGWISTETGFDIKPGIKVQLGIIRDYCRNHNLEIYDEYVDEGADLDLFSRPSMSRLLADAEAGKFSRVIVYRTDMISHNSRALIQFGLETLVKYGVGLKSLMELYELNTMAGQMMFVTVATLVGGDPRQVQSDGPWEPLPDEVVLEFEKIQSELDAILPMAQLSQYVETGQDTEKYGV